TLYPAHLKAKANLPGYGSHFTDVVVDASFYAVQSVRNANKWVGETPDSIRFFAKVYQVLSRHERKDILLEYKSKMFQVFKDSLKPYQGAGKLAIVIFQFPRWFDCRKKNVDYLRYCKKMMGDIPVALEFRHQSWFSERYRASTLSFMKEEGWIHAIADEPQAGERSIPIVPVATNPDKTLIRMHGRNVHGWNKPRDADTNWREVRYLYRYNQEELLEWKNRIEELQKDTRDIIILFNNNSGGD